MSGVKDYVYLLIYKNTTIIWNEERTTFINFYFQTKHLQLHQRWPHFNHCKKSIRIHKVILEYLPDNQTSEIIVRICLLTDFKTNNNYFWKFCGDAEGSNLIVLWRHTSECYADTKCKWNDNYSIGIKQLQVLLQMLKWIHFWIFFSLL